MRVEDIADKTHPSIYADELATKARAALRERGLRTLPVLSKRRRLVGIISRSHILAISSSVSPIRVKGIMSAPKYTATPEMDVHPVVQKMLRLDSWYVPVVRSLQDNTYVGMLGLENFIAAALKRKNPRFTTPLEEIMSTELLTCSVEDEIDNVWRAMREKSFSGCPVVSRGKPVGIFTQANLLEHGIVFPAFEAKKGRFRAPSKISTIMKVPVISLGPTDTVEDAAELMLKRNIGHVPIVDRQGNFVGIVDREDIVRALVV